MITWTSLSPRALEAVVEGRITRADVKAAFARLDALMDGPDRVDMLADVCGDVSIDLAAIGEEMHHFSAVGRMLGRMDRIALVADPAWIQVLARIEAHLVPGIDYRVFRRAQAEQARAFVMREDETAPGESSGGSMPVA